MLILNSHLFVVNTSFYTFLNFMEFFFSFMFIEDVVMYFSLLIMSLSGNREW